MGKLQEFLMQDKQVIDQTIEVPINGFPFPFLVKAITEGENKIIKKSCMKTTFDRKTHQKQSDLDSDLYNSRLVTACCVDPNFKDAALQELYGVRGAEDLIDVMLKPGQYIDLIMAVQDVNGFTDDINDLVEEAKN